MEKIDNLSQEQKLLYPIPAQTFEYKGRYVPSYLPMGPISQAENIYVSKEATLKPKKYPLQSFIASIKKYLYNVSLKTAFSIYVISYIAAAILVSILIIALLVVVRTNSYDTQLNYLLTFISAIIICILFLVSILTAGLHFYRNRLEPPLELLNEASLKITGEDLDFAIEYARADEMGKLCDSFEKMRQTLEMTYTELFRQFEERKRLNSVFSHDLRTPLTVLKGNILLLSEYLKAENVEDPKIYESLSAMNNHVLRLENYVDIMSRLQKLEDIEINPRTVDRRDFTRLIHNNAEIMCENHILRFFDDIQKETLNVDSEIILTVVENLLSNAVRFASKVITVVCSYSNDNVIISVSDDGEGFTEEGLLLASNPFYKRNKNVFDTHFGLGLNISKTLAQKHSGRLVIENIDAGGALVRVEFLDTLRNAR